MRAENLPRYGKRDPFKNVLATMTEGRQGVAIIVDDDEKCVGILTDGDLRRIFERYDRVSEIRLEEVYTANPKTISHEVLATEALKKMQDNKITSLIVVDQDKIVGLLHIHHLLEQGLY